MGVRWPKQARHTPQMDRFRMRGEELAVAAPARPSGRDGVMASAPPPRRRCLLPAGRCWSCLSVHADSLERSPMTKLSTVLYTHEPGLIARLLGAVLEAVHAYSVR
jgi:hypothetical protein